MLCRNPFTSLALALHLCSSSSLWDFNSKSLWHSRIHKHCSRDGEIEGIDISVFVGRETLSTVINVDFPVSLPVPVLCLCHTLSFSHSVSLSVPVSHSVSLSVPVLCPCFTLCPSLSHSQSHSLSLSHSLLPCLLPLH